MLQRFHLLSVYFLKSSFFHAHHTPPKTKPLKTFLLVQSNLSESGSNPIIPKLLRDWPLAGIFKLTITLDLGERQLDWNAFQVCWQLYWAPLPKKRNERKNLYCQRKTDILLSAHEERRIYNHFTFKAWCAINSQLQGHCNLFIFYSVVQSH